MMMESKSFSIAELTLPLNIRSPIVFEREFSNGSYGNVVRTGKAAAVRCHPFRCLIRLDLLVRRSSLLWVWGVWASSPIAETYLCGFPIHEYCISILPSAPSLTVTVRRLPRCDRLKLLPTWRTPRLFLVRTSRSRRSNFVWSSTRFIRLVKDLNLISVKSFCFICISLILYRICCAQTITSCPNELILTSRKSAWQ